MLKHKIMMKYKLYMGLLLGIMTMISCREEFEIQYEVGDQAPILVVEGYIDAGSTSSQYKLSSARPVGTSGNAAQGGISGAVITIESEDGVKYNSSGGFDGNYLINHPVLSSDRKYRLLIQVGNDRYESAFVEVKVSPAISEVEWSEVQQGVEIYVSTKDESQNSRYYRYEYEEDWRYSAPYYSSIIYEDGEVRDRNFDERIDLCYLSDRSTSILLANSSNLATDAIHRFPVVLVPTNSVKLSYRYSILVRQIALTEASYTYWEQLRESSENLGDVFGPMPSEVRGNITCVTDPNKRVIGMAEAASPATKRIYINRNDLEEFWPVRDEYYSGCMYTEEPISIAMVTIRANPSFLLINAVSNNPSSPDPTDYTYSGRRCVDCRVKGGNVTPPDFWEAR